MNGDSSHGHGSSHGSGHAPGSSRIIEVPLQTSELLEINLDELQDETIDEIADLFIAEQAPVLFWIKLLDEYHRRGRLDTAVKLGERGLVAFNERQDKASTVPLLCMMASYAMIQSRSAPKTIIQNPRQYRVKSESKSTFFQRATSLVAQAESIDSRNGFVLDTKANLYLLTGKMDDAFRTFEFILTQSPGHLFALMGKARVLYVRRQFKAALKLYQFVLSAAPDILPDPRIGIGLCFWNLGEHAIARRAWERSRSVNPGRHSTGASLLLGLSWLNVARSPQLEEDERAEVYGRGVHYVQEAWAIDKTCAATAAALSGYFLAAANKWDTVIKLAELAIQHGDARTVISDGQLAIARALHAQGKLDEATRHYLLAMEANPEQILAALGVGQMYVQRQDYPAAVNAFENVVRKQPRSIEAIVSLASIHAKIALAATSSSAASDGNTDRARAQELFDQVVRLFQGTADLKDGLGQKNALDPLGPRIQQIATDPDFYVEVARLSTGEDMNKSLQAYRRSLEARQQADEACAKSELGHQESSSVPETSTPSKLLCNIGSLEFARGDYENAQERFEEAITLDLERQEAGVTQDGDAVMMTLMYNLGVVMEARGQQEEAKQLYEERLLARHPEFVEAKARLAALALSQKQHERCSEYLKAALTARPENPDVRALYVHFLIEAGNPSTAKDFAVATLKDFNKVDVYALSAMAHLLYQQARESKGNRLEDAKDRTSRYYRACEAFDRVLQLDSNNAYAAQGLAIALAESNLGGKAAQTPGPQLASNESAQRAKNLRDALSILTKVRETANDGNVYVNIGLCHFLRDEWDRAIESFETANNRFYSNKHLPTLLYLARARFHKANKEQSFDTLQAALQAAQLALELAPKDDSIRFNIALIQQRGLETVQTLPPSRRRISEIQTALSDTEAAQETFAALAGNTGPNLLYSTDLADQRRRYGEGLVKKAPATLREQTDWEESEQNKVEMAKRDRQAERGRQAELERQRREEARRQADVLTSQRRQLMEDSKSWYVKPVSESEDEDEKGKKGKGRKKKAEDEGIVPDGEGEEAIINKPKKRKKKVDAGEDGAGSGGKKKAKRAKKSEGPDGGDDVAGGPSKRSGSVPDVRGGGVDEDDEDEGPRLAGGASRRGRKQFRTAELIEDSDVSD